jgi:hypothetical protein
LLEVGKNERSYRKSGLSVPYLYILCVK